MSQPEVCKVGHAGDEGQCNFWGVCIQVAQEKNHAALCMIFLFMT